MLLVDLEEGTHVVCEVYRNGALVDGAALCSYLTWVAMYLMTYVVARGIAMREEVAVKRSFSSYEKR